MVDNSNGKQWLVATVPDSGLYKAPPMVTVAPGERNLGHDMSVVGRFDTQTEALSFIREHGAACAPWDIDYAGAVDFMGRSPFAVSVNTHDAIIVRGAATSAWGEQVIDVYPASALVFDARTRVKRVVLRRSAE